MGLFIRVEVEPEVARDAVLARRLAEVCPVNIFAAPKEGGLEILEENVDECTLCELCLQAAPGGKVRVIKLYEEARTGEQAR
jgi:NAD-dependent dihydropyrimidine dehydrogenase PreA subunit